MKQRRYLIALLSLALVIVTAVNLAGCALTSVSASDNLLDGIDVESSSGKAADDSFISAQMRLSVDLFKKTAAAEAATENNVMISPLSVALALAMTANGAAGQTRAEMEALLGGEITIEDLNEYLCGYAKSLTSGNNFKLDIANSIWFKDGLNVEKDFLETDMKYYGADAYKSPFDQRTLKDINNWVKSHTDGMIEDILDEIPAEAVMYLINAIAFDAEWDTKYAEYQVQNGEFTSSSGETKTVEMMHSGEYVYLDDGNAVGFIKNYKGDKYSFAALLPNEGTDIDTYIAGLTGDGLLETLRSADHTSVSAALPKFSFAYGTEMRDTLTSLGMPTAFDSARADFSKLAKPDNGNIYIGRVLHKAFISVNESGTKAGAATVVEMLSGGVMEPKTVVLDRPFVFMILDNDTNLPIFIGALRDIQK